MVKFIEYGNGEVIHDGMMDKKTMELENYPAGAFKGTMKVEENPGSENICLVSEDGTVGTFYKGEEPVEIFEEEEREEKKVQT